MEMSAAAINISVVSSKSIFLNNLHILNVQQTHADNLLTNTIYSKVYSSEEGKDAKAGNLLSASTHSPLRVPAANKGRDA